jgi:hypothetical protein
MFIKYQLEDGSELWVESSDESGVVRASVGDKFQEAQQSFVNALESAKQSALLLRRQFEEALADEVEITFGLKATGEIGNNIFAVGKAGVEANYTVTLKWKKKEEHGADQYAQFIKHKRSLRKNRAGN